MKRQLLRFATVGAVAAGMMFAQAPAPALAPVTQNQTTPAKQSGKPMNHRAMARRRMFRQLQLTAAQKEHAKTIFQQARETAKPVREQLQQNRQAMAAAVKTGDHAQIERLSTTRGELMGKLTAQRTEAMAKFYRELSPQQRAQADRIHQRTEARVRERRQQRRAIGSNS